MSFVAGGRTNARCSRCKDVTSHVVIVVVDNMPVKVECCACRSIHKYYAPEVAKKKKEEGPLRVRSDQSREKAVENASKRATISSATSSTSSTSRSSAKKSAPKNSEEVRALWHQKMAKSFAEAKTYRMDLSVKVGDTIEHPVFGSGIVQTIVATDKAEFLFAEGIKLLKCDTK